MKRRLFVSCIILFFGSMLLFPGPVFDGSVNGLLLWFQIVLPTLLPFMIICNLLISTHAAAAIARITSPLLSRIFAVSEYGSFAVLVGFLCGYPMGAKVTADLIRNGSITKKEGQYLLSFCNNTSPMFIISFLVMQNLKNESLLFPALAILFLSPILLSFLFRRFHKIEKRTGITPIPADSGHFPAKIIDESIMNGIEAITKVGGYIMLFSILISLASQIPCSSAILSSLFLPSLEITNGIHMLCTVSSAAPGTFILTLALTSFGGWCSIAQTRCMLENTGLSLLPYIIEKLITAVATSLFAYIFILL